MLNYAKLLPAGRAKAIGIPWSAEELVFLQALEQERGLARPVAADYIRNGILSVDDYDKAVKKKFQPVPYTESHGFLNEKLVEQGKKAIKSRKVAKKASSKKI